MNDNYTILYVDDEDILLTATKVYLERSGKFFVDTASSASEGLNKLTENEYDAIISDYEMPEMNGITFLSTVRSAGNDIPFIIFTGRGREDVVIDALNNGVDFYLQKGGQPKAQFAELTNKITQAVRRKRAENEIEASKKMAIALLNAASEAEMLIASDGKIMALNRLMAKRFGKEPSHLLEQNAFADLPPGLFSLKDSIKRQHITGNTPFCYEESVQGRHYRTTINPVLNQQGETDSYAVFSKDMTDQLSTEESLASAKEHLDVTLKSIGDGVIVTDENCIITSLNRIAEVLTGWSEEDAIGKPIDEVFRLTDLNSNERINPAIQAIESGNTVHITDDCQLESRHKDTYIVGDSVAPIKDRNSHIKGSVIVFRDITREKEAQDYKNYLASIIESAEDGIIGTDTDAMITTWNNGAEAIFGYTEEEVLGQRIDLIYPEGYESELNSVFRRVTDGNSIRHHMTRRKSKNGEIIDVSLTLSPIVNERNEITGTSGILRDIGDIVKAKQKIEESYTWCSTMLRSIGDAIISTDTNQNVTYMNPVAESLTGWSLDEARNRPINEIFAITNEYTGEVTENPIEAVLREGTVVGLANHTILTARNGDVWPIDDSGAPIINADGEITGAVIVFREISARKKAEKILRDSESKYRALFNSTGAATVIIEKEGTILLSNAGFEKLSGYQSPAIDGRMKWMDFVDTKSLALMSERSRRRDGKSSPYHDSYEFTFIDRSGASRDILLILESIEGSSNVVCNLIDISGQKKVQNDLIESKNKLRVILNSLPHIVVQKDRDLRILWANTAAKKLNPDLIGMTCYESFLAQNEPCSECNALKAIESGEIQRKKIFHEDVAGKGGSYWEKTSIPIVDTEGNCHSVVELTKDITSKEQSKNKFLFQHNLAEKLSVTSSLDDAIDVLFTSLLEIPGIDSGTLYLTDDVKGGFSLVRSIGITEEFKNAVSYLEPESGYFNRLAVKKPVYGCIDDVSPHLADISGWEGVRSFVYIPVVASDEILGACFLISHENCEVSESLRYIIESAIDLIGNSFSRVLTEEKLRESGQKLEIALKSADLFVWEYFIEGQKIKWNNNVLNRLGYACDDVIDYDWWSSLVHPEDQHEKNKGLTAAISGNSEFYSNKYRIQTSSGEWRWLNVLGKVTNRDSNGNATHLTGVIQDITRLKDDENALKVANKKLNLLSSITRHDIINQVTSALIYLEMTRDMNEDDHALLENLDVIENSVNVIASQIEFTRDYQDLGLELPIWQGIASTVEHAGTCACPDSIELDISDICSDIEILADPMFEKIFSNLFDNSVRHGEGVSAISVHCRKDGGDLKIIYHDNGPGIPADMKNKIFIKGIGKNTGLGLFLIKEILEITGMKIEENGIPGEYAQFEIFVPCGKWRGAGTSRK